MNTRGKSQKKSNERSDLSDLPAFALSPGQVAQVHNVTISSGLASSTVPSLQEKYGKNELEPEPPTPLWKLVLQQFEDQLVIILLLAAIISFVLAALETDEKEKETAFVEPIVILLILIANALVGVIQETNAEKAIEALKEYSPDEAKVIRDGHLQKIEARELVPGDVVVLAVGDKIPADCRLVSVSSASFRVDQSVLTGEAVSVAKEPEYVVKDTNAVKQDQINMLFSGTTVTVGKAKAIVALTGSNTAIGEIHESISSQIEEKTPLKVALDDFGDSLARIISVICILVWLINIQHFNDDIHGSWLKGAIYYFKIAVALAVAAIPEGLAVIITTCLALGTQKMAKQGAIVRRLASVETLGCTSVICSDKTGTLTTNRMSVRKVLVFDKQGGIRELDVEGSSYGPEGQILQKGKPVDKKSLLSNNGVLNELSHICALCNDAKVVYDEISDQFQNVGEPTEAALKTLVEKLGTDDPVFNESIPVIPDVAALLTLDKSQKLWRCSQVDDRIQSQYNLLKTLEFSRDRKSMSVLVEKVGEFEKETPNASLSSTLLNAAASRLGRATPPPVPAPKQLLYVKGAPEAILERCTQMRTNASYGKAVALTVADRALILNKVAQWGEESALRVLALATVDKPSIPEKIDASSYAQYEANMVFVGLVGMMDPPRDEVKDSIAKCKQAGIRVIVITGDNKKTAEAICRSIGVFDDAEEVEGKSFTGREFDAMSPEEKLNAVRTGKLFSRTEPIHKSELVDLLKSDGEIVAMTGDGVNDAPALKKADIGVAMGTGTDVAKLASDMVLADDNFATIVSAVEEGRSIYANTKQFIRYLISSNIGEVVSIFLTVLLGMPEALIPVQLLWVNLVTDGLPATALGFNPPDDDIMILPPRSSKEPIVTSWLFVRYMIVGTFVGAATVFGYAWWFMFYESGPKISFYQLTHFHSCNKLFPEIGCEMFSGSESIRATTVSLSILVVVEMFNAMNSLSENQSLLTFPLYKNWYLVIAICLSMALHFMILYVPFFTNLFSITALNQEEWKAVLLISAPVIIIDEVLKWVTRTFIYPSRNSHHAKSSGKFKSE